MPWYLIKTKLNLHTIQSACGYSIAIIPFHCNTITDEKASLALLHVISDNKGFPNQDFNYAQPRHVALHMLFWQTEVLDDKYTESGYL